MLERYSTLLLAALFVIVALVGYETSDIKPVAEVVKKTKETPDRLPSKGWLKDFNGGNLSPTASTTPLPLQPDHTPFQLEMVLSTFDGRLLLPSTKSPHSAVAGSRKNHLIVTLRVSNGVLRKSVTMDQWEDLTAREPAPKTITLVPAATTLGEQVRFFLLAPEIKDHMTDGSLSLLGPAVKIEVLAFEIHALAANALPPESNGMTVDVHCLVPETVTQLIPEGESFKVLDLVAEYREDLSYKFDYHSKAAAIYRQKPTTPPVTNKENKEMAHLVPKLPSIGM